MRIVILTGSSLRHDFVRKAIGLNRDIEVLRSYCEKLDQALPSVIENTQTDSGLQHEHLAARHWSEEDYFLPFIRLTPDHTHPTIIPPGALNDPEIAGEIKALAPDLLVAYGCSIVKEPLLSLFLNKAVNLHLGLSPYYRGAGTNFWPLVNGEPEYVGATFMQLDAGIDTGQVIHQIRAVCRPGDTPHQIGNRLIAHAAVVYQSIIKDFHSLPTMDQIPTPDRVRVYKRKDFSPASVKQLYAGFAANLIEDYLANQEQRDLRAPIVSNPMIPPVYAQ
jgi:phosphoribosylglycinamide formyltransferase 1